jgi:hypothetical protein
MIERETQTQMDMTFETFCNEVQTYTSYTFLEGELRELFDDGYTVDEAVDLAEWKLDEDLFGEALTILGDL